MQLSEFYLDLEKSLKTGFLDQTSPSKQDYLPQLLVNDKNVGRKVLTTLVKELNKCQEFWFSVAFVTKGGVIAIINYLKELEDKGIKGKILVSQYQNFTQPEALRTLLQLSNIELKIVTNGNFHAKGYLFRKSQEYTLIVGSSNLTDTALSSNKEWNLKISATDNSLIITNILEEFNSEFEKAIPVDRAFLVKYEEIYKFRQEILFKGQLLVEQFQDQDVVPNSMQKDALINLRKLREENKDRGLLISATGTGKTYLSAFDVKEFNAKKLLFVVHRANIAQAALNTFKRVFGNTRTFGMYSGNQKELDADFIFSTIQTISQDYDLSMFDKRQFDYIVIDETHRIGADSYQKLISYFKPKFILGMTATPERTDGFDIFKQFEYNLAYEIRLQRALDVGLICTFHYFGVIDIIVDNKEINHPKGFNLLVSEQRVNHIIEKSKFYGCDNGSVRGLIFCSSVEECKQLSQAFNRRGFKTVAITGSDSTEAKQKAISQLELEDGSEKLDYIFTVDVFNEGIDIPKINQIIMLRPTQSAIVFVQQLGRGLRKAENKEYLTVIDFIRNYNNNFLIPIALFGDTTYNKDRLRKLMVAGSALIPGASTVNFDRIAQEKIFKSIDSANLSIRKDLSNDYKLLKYRLGRSPMMVDFIEQGSRDPYQYVEYSKSYFNFVAQEEANLKLILSPVEKKILELLSSNIANTKRIEEVVILEKLLSEKSVSVSEIKKVILEKYKVVVKDETILSCIRNINFEFVKSPHKIILLEKNILRLQKEFLQLLKNNSFNLYIKDALIYSRLMYDEHFEINRYVDGFILYHKYSRKDVCRILNWEKDEQSTIYGYKVKGRTCPIFVNYHKEEGIASTTKYEDKFKDNHEFIWMSRSRRTLDSEEIKKIIDKKSKLRLPLFIKKSNDEGNEFYYMGEVTPEKFEQTKIKTDQGDKVPIVRVNFSMNHPVEDSIYEYLIKTEDA